MAKPMSPNPFKNIFKQNNLSGKKLNSGINNNSLVNNNSSLTSQKSATLPIKEQKIDQIDFREMQTSPFVKKTSEKKPSVNISNPSSSSMNKSLKNYMDNKLSQNNSGISRPSTSNTNSISNPPSDTRRISGRSLSDNLITPQVINKTIKEIYVLNKVGFAGEGVDKTNQDSYFIHENFYNKTNNSYLGVW
jgi:hypothetical protein